MIALTQMLRQLLPHDRTTVHANGSAGMLALFMRLMMCQFS